MTNLRQDQSSKVAELEKEGEISDISRNSPSLFLHHGSNHDIESQLSSLAATDDIRAHPVIATASVGQNDDLTRTSTVIRLRSLVSLTRISTRSNWSPGPPPNGGLAAWAQVAIGHLVIINTWGFINSFGVFQTYYVESLGQPPSEIAWVGSIQVFLLFFIGTWTGRLTDAGYFKQIFFVGTLLQVLGIFMTSLSTQYWQLFLAQGVCVGLGNGCLFCPIVSVVSTYFSTRRSLAIGIVASGSATGGLIFPVMVQQLLPRVGFGWTIRSLGFVELSCLIICNVFAKERIAPRASGPIVEWAAFKEISYTLFAIGMFFIFWGVYFAFYYIASFARNIISVSYTESINLILVLNSVGIAGRVIPNHFADQVTGPFNMMIPICATGSIVIYCMAAVQTQADLYIWAITYGICGAATQSLFPAVLTSLTTDLRKSGVRMGMIFSIVSFAVLTGPPIAGALIQSAGGRYLYAQLFAATAILIGTGFLIGARIASSGWTLKVKM